VWQTSLYERIFFALASLDIFRLNKGRVEIFRRTKNNVLLFSRLIFELRMFTRIHSLKFQNQLAKETMKQSMQMRVEAFFKEGMLLTLFVDIDDTTLYFINVWNTELESKRINNKHKEIFQQLREMGIKVDMIGGLADCRYSDPNLLNHFKKIET